MIGKVPKIYDYLKEERELTTKLSDEVGRKLVTMYRAVAKDQDFFKDRDYVTLSKRFAVEHAENNMCYTEEPQKVIATTVWTDELYNATNTGEYFYSGKDHKGRTIYNTLGDDYEGYEEIKW